MMDQEIEGRVKVVTQQKKICQYNKEGKLKYNKGYIVGQNVLPLYFEEGEMIDESNGQIDEPTIEFDLCSDD
jgi:hypothetical protein